MRNLPRPAYPMMQKLTQTAIVSLLSTVSTLVLAQPLVANTEPAQSEPVTDFSDRNSSFEFAGISFGLGTAGSEPALAFGFRFATLRWEHAAWSVLDILNTSGFSGIQLVKEEGDCGPLRERECTLRAETGLTFIGTRPYYKINRDSMGHHQVWLGLGAGVMLEDSTRGGEAQQVTSTSARFSLSPSVHYVVAANEGMNIGLGAKIAAGLGDRYDTGRIPFMMLVGIEVGLNPMPPIRRVFQ